MYFDIGIVAIAVIGALVGMWKGFFKSFNRLIATGAAFVVIYFALGYVTDYLFGLAAFEKIFEGVAKLMGKLAPEGLGEATVATLPDVLNGNFFKFMVPAITRAVTADPAASIPDMFGLLLARTTFSIVLALIMYWVVRLVLIILVIILDSFTRDRDVTGFSRLLGFVVGAARGAVFAGMIIIIACPFMSFIPATVLEDYNKNSVVAKPAIEFVHENVAKFMDYDAILGTAPSEGDDDTEPTPGDNAELSTAQAEVATKISEATTAITALRDNAIANVLTGDNNALAKYLGYAEYTKAGGTLTNYINSLPKSTVAECNNTVDAIQVLVLALNSEESDSLSSAFTTLKDATVQADAIVALDAFLDKYTAMLTLLSSQSTTTLNYPADALAWQTLGTPLLPA